MNNSVDIHQFDFKTTLPDWQIDLLTRTLSRIFVFKDFEAAFAFMTLCAGYAEKIDHHPDWSNSWNQVKVQLCTQSANDVTTLDIELAKAMDAFANQIQNPA
jgi:4a-hydroxytetrahydrobiopterin dehydratase